MFTVEPNNVYTIKDLAEVSGFAQSTIYEMVKKGMKSKKGPGGQMVTGRAILDYFESEEEETFTPEIVKKLQRLNR